MVMTHVSSGPTASSEFLQLIQQELGLTVPLPDPAKVTITEALRAYEQRRTQYEITREQLKLLKAQEAKQVRIPVHPSGCPEGGVVVLPDTAKQGQIPVHPSGCPECGDVVLPDTAKQGQIPVHPSGCPECGDVVLPDTVVITVPSDLTLEEMKERLHQEYVAKATFIEIKILESRVQSLEMGVDFRQFLKQCLEMKDIAKSSLQSPTARPAVPEESPARHHGWEEEEDDEEEEEASNSSSSSLVLVKSSSLELDLERLSSRDGSGGSVPAEDVDVPAEDPVADPTDQSPVTTEHDPVALLFPPAGSATVGMMAQVQDLPEVQDWAEQASAIVRQNVLHLCLNGPQKDLAAASHVAVFLGGMAALAKLKQEKPEAVERVQACAGLGIGEYTALCAAGVLEIEDGLRLAQLRSDVMREASERGAAVSVAGLDKAALEALCKEARERAVETEGEEALCKIVSEPSPQRFTCAGTRAAIRHVFECVYANGKGRGKGKAKDKAKVKLLSEVRAGAGCLAPKAAAALGRALQEALPRMRPPHHAVYMSAAARRVEPGSDPQVFIELLQRQLDGPVLWEETARQIIGPGTMEIYELGPKKRLKATMRCIDPQTAERMMNVEV